MAEQTFTSGQILTAAQMTTLQANTGLAYIKEQAVAASGSSFTVTGAFSTTYDNYKIVWTNIGGSSGRSAYMTIGGSAGSTYNVGGRFIPFTGASGETQATASALGFWIGVAGTGFSGEIDLFRPFTATATNAVVMSSSSTYTSMGAGYDSNAASSTAFTVTVPGTLTAGLVTVFGYRKS